MNADLKSSSTQSWLCSVCGYVHRGPAPPDECPVCGAPKAYFEPQDEPQNQPGEKEATATPQKWRCLICNHEHSGPEPPNQCPVCDAPGKRFEAIMDSAEKNGGETSKQGKIVVLGSGIAGVSAVESIRKVAPEMKITILSKEKTLPYYRLNLTRYLAGEVTEESLPIHPESWYGEKGNSFIPGADVSVISLDKKEVSLADGTSYPYDKLILTAGAHPFVPPIPGIRLTGVTTLRNLEDAQYILQESQKVKSIVVVGGGVLGLETAGALAKGTGSGQVTLLENFKWLMPRQLNETAATLLQHHVEGIGISLKVNASVKELVGDERVAGVVLADGETLPADLVIITTGVRANSYLPRLAGLQVNQGVIIDNYMQTSAPDVYAAGDISEHQGTLYGLWNAAQYQGSIAGLNAAGKTAEFGGLPRSNSIKVLGVDLLSIGKFEAEDGSDVIFETQYEGNYLRFVFRDSHLVGAILYGNTAISGHVKKAIETKTDFSGLLKKQPNATDIWNYLED